MSAPTLLAAATSSAAARSAARTIPDWLQSTYTRHICDYGFGPTVEWQHQKAL